MKRVKQHTGKKWGTFYQLEKAVHTNPKATPIEDILQYGFKDKTYGSQERIIEMNPVTKLYILDNPGVQKSLVGKKIVVGALFRTLYDEINMLYYALDRPDVKININNQMLDEENYTMPIGEIFFGVTNHLSDWCWEEFKLSENNVLSPSSIQETFTMNFIDIKERNK